MFVIVIGITTFMTLKNTGDLMGILEESITSRLISTSIAARELLDLDKFESYNSLEDMENDADAYLKTRDALRNLKNQTSADYIYALKFMNGKNYFIFDTDEEVTSIADIFEEYPLSIVHERAYLGEEAAGVMNVVDEYGSFNTGAVPIWLHGKIIGIMCTDIEDTFIEKGNTTSRTNAIALIATLLASLVAMGVIVLLLLRNLKEVQDKLFHMANYDVLTGLPNRQFLMNYLPEVAEKATKKQTPFAFLLIDLDNFKKVNDNAGHDAGDELLRHIAVYLNSVHENSKSFRPPAGALNVSARIGGDEFVQIVPNVKTLDEAEFIAKKMLTNFGSQKLDRFIEKYQVGMSIGVALFPIHTENYNVLIKYADIAMYHAKKNGKNNYSIYNDTMSKDPDTSDTAQEGQDRDRRHYRR